MEHFLTSEHFADASRAVGHCLLPPGHDGEHTDQVFVCPNCKAMVAGRFAHHNGAIGGRYFCVPPLGETGARC